MSNQNNQITISKKQVFLFLGGAVAITTGVLFAVSSLSDKGVSSPPDTEDSQEVAIKGKKDDGFLGEKGETLLTNDGNVYIDETKVDDGNMHAFNYFSEAEKKTIYFFVVRASDGTYRVAANACEVCFNAKKGFTQKGDMIRCENCRVTYPKDKIALEKGGCNPGPIDKNAKVENDQLVISISNLEKVAYLF